MAAERFRERQQMAELQVALTAEEATVVAMAARRYARMARARGDREPEAGFLAAVDAVLERISTAFHASVDAAGGEQGAAQSDPAPT